MQSITISNLTFAYPGQTPLFENCQLNFNDQWKLGLVGRNGRGKTTFLKLLLGQLSYQGEITTNLHFSYYPLNISTPDDLAINCLTAAVPDVEQWEIERELNLMNVDSNLLWQPFNTLSGGEQTKLQLATLFAQSDSFILLDEPTNHLDQNGRQDVAQYLHQHQTGMIVVSHDQSFIDQVVDHILAIEQHQLILEQGNYSSYFHQKKLRDQNAMATNQQLKSDIKKLKATKQQHQTWATKAENQKKHNSHADKGFIGAKAAKMMKKTVITNQRIENAIEDKRGLLNEIETIVPLTINVQPLHQPTLLKLTDVQLAYQKDQPLFKPISLTQKRHQQIALCGDNGSGKSSLFHAIMHNFTSDLTGHIEIANNCKISLVRQNYADNVGSLAEFAQQTKIDFNALLNTLRKLGMPRECFNQPIEHMSMGQQKKVELARSLVEPANLYLWDEPLNYLDTYNQQQLIQLVREFQLPLLFIEHDQRFINAIAEQKIILQ